jgi:hypothetical protein
MATDNGGACLCVAARSVKMGRWEGRTLLGEHPAGGSTDKSRGRKDLMSRGVWRCLALRWPVRASLLSLSPTMTEGRQRCWWPGPRCCSLRSSGNRLKSVRYGGVELELRDKADEAKARGDLETAEVLERAADVVGNRVASTARSYALVRGAMPAGDERTALMERIFAEAQSEAFASYIDREDVLSRLWTGSEGARVWALGVVEARPDLATTRAVLEAVERPDHMFDQFHALATLGRPKSRV